MELFHEGRLRFYNRGHGAANVFGLRCWCSRCNCWNLLLEDLRCCWWLTAALLVEMERWRLMVLVEEELLDPSGRNAAGSGEAALLSFGFKRGWTVGGRLAAVGGCFTLVSLVFEDAVVFMEAVQYWELWFGWKQSRVFRLNGHCHGWKASGCWVGCDDLRVISGFVSCWQSWVHDSVHLPLQLVGVKVFELFYYRKKEKDLDPMVWVILNHWYLEIYPGHWLNLRTNAFLVLLLVSEHTRLSWQVEQCWLEFLGDNLQGFQSNKNYKVVWSLFW